MKQKQNRLVVADAGWAETIPKWILEEVKQERLVNGLIGIMKGKEDIGDAEVLTYLYTACLRSSVSHEFAEIYIYLTGKVMQKAQKLKEEELPDFVRDKVKKGLTQQEEYELKIIKQDLFRARGGRISSPLLNVLRELKDTKVKGGKNNGTIL